MTGQMKKRAGLSENQQKQFAGLIVLDRVVTVERAYHAGLLDKEDDELLDPVFKYLMGEKLAEIGDDDYYRATEMGSKAYQGLLHQQQSYLAHFDIYARVDLAEGTFWDSEMDSADDPRWADLRVAVAEFKGIDAYRMVFLAMVAEEKFYENPDWKFDLALGSTFFTELEEVVASQIAMDELGYEAEDGARISGEGVIEDIIIQGAKINRERYESSREEAMRQEALFEEEEREEDDSEYDEETEWVMMPYDPWAPMAGYAASALFVEALWLSALW